MRVKVNCDESDARQLSPNQSASIRAMQRRKLSSFGDFPPPLSTCHLFLGGDEGVNQVTNTARPKVAGFI